MATYTEEDVGALIDMVSYLVRTQGNDWAPFFRSLTPPVKTMLTEELLDRAMEDDYNINVLYDLNEADPGTDLGVDALRCFIDDWENHNHDAHDSILDSFSCTTVRKLLLDYLRDEYYIAPLAGVAAWYVRAAKARDEWEGDADDLAIADLVRD